ncbi:matrixin family metalloprotease [Bacillus rhizoplanae]|uniref:matrixin family metalloprotease n=1 Tax=Bacillus rhizoplanae TaxID=2880966 RepID=UPI003D1E7879
MTLLLPQVTSVSAHFLGYDSVDSFNDVDWGSSTKWTTERNYAHYKWAASSPVDFYADTAYSNKDLHYYDSSRSDVTWAGLYDYNGAYTDYIYFNNYYMNRFDPYQRRNVAIHEVGHALGLAHNSYTSSVMYPYVTRNVNLSSHDISDVNALH